MEPKTLKQAYSEGWEEYDSRKHYGGIQITVKGHHLIKRAECAMSRSAWKQLGYDVKIGEIPHGTLTHIVGAIVTYDVYRKDQVTRKRKKVAK